MTDKESIQELRDKIQELDRQLSARDQTIASLSAENKHLKNLLENLNIGYLLIDKNFCVLEHNRVADEITKIKHPKGAKPHLGDSPFKIMDAEGFEKPFDQLPVAISFKEKRPVKDVILVLVNDTLQEPIWTLNSVSPLFDSNGDIEYMVLTFADITEYKKAIDAVTTFFDSSLVMFFIAEVSTGNLIRVNKKVCQVLGYTEEEIYSVPFIERIHPDDQESTRELLKNMANGKAAMGFRNRHRASDGTYKMFEWNGSIDPTNSFIYAIAVDITDKARLEAQRFQAEKLQAIGSLAGGIAHDLNNMLLPVIGYTEMLMSGMVSGDQQRKIISEINRAGERSKELIHQLLAFSRKQVLEPQPIDLNTVVKDLLALLRRSIREDIEVQTRFADDLPTIKADVSQIEQVVLNLTVNAQESMPNGGRMIIETCVVELDENYCATHLGSTPGPHVMLSVADSGAGMDEETKRNIFEPFFSTKGEKGTGLGLSTTYGIVKQHGGSIWVYSELEKGTVFKVYFPANSDQVEDKKMEESISSIPNGTETILLAEDFDEARELVTDSLQVLGYKVLAAESGKQAIDLMKNYQGDIDLLVADVIIPDMNGKELYQQLAVLQPGLKVLFMSGYTDSVISGQGVLDQGVNFLQKPFSLTAFTSKIRSMLDD